MMIANVDPSTPIALLYELADKSYTINEVGAVGNGLGTWLSLSPVGGAVGGATVVDQSAVFLNLQGTQQLTELTNLVGQPLSFGPVPTVVGGTGKYVAFYPAAGMSSDGYASSGSYLYGHSSDAGAHSAVLKLSGSHSADQVLGHSGKAYTVVKSKLAAGGGSKLFLVESCDAAHKVKEILVINVKNGGNETATLVGKSFTFGKAPSVAGGAGGKYILLKPVTGAAGKATAGAAMASKGVVVKSATLKGATLKGATLKSSLIQGAAPAAPVGATAGHGVWQHVFGGGAVKGVGSGLAGSGAAAVGGATMAAKTAAASTVGKSAAVAASGSMLSAGAGGLGFGLGMGPLVVVVLAVATAYGVGRYQKKLREVDVEM